MRRKNFNLASAITGIGIGAALMYLFDPAYGKRRRALVRDKAVRFSHVIEGGTEVLAEDLKNRTRGLAASAGRPRSQPTSDNVLVARVRSKMGRWVSHPHAVEVEALNGLVTLSGPILASETQQLIHAVRKISGVKDVENRLTEHHDPENVPSLQGGEKRQQPFEYLQRNWSPTARLLAGACGGALTVFGITKRGYYGWISTAAGTTLLARAATNLEIGKLTGITAGRKAIGIEKAIVVNADPDLVFSIWSSYKAFPFLMSHIKQVEDLGNDRSRWTVTGAAGFPIEFTARLTKWVPGRELAWETEEQSFVQHTGEVRFDKIDGGTRVQVRFFYNPPAGAVGHAFALLLGSDPEKIIEEDLARVKTSIETGNLPHDAGGRPSPESRA